MELKKTALIGLLMASSVLAGCASSGNRAIAQESETSIQSKITEGVTTKSQVRSSFGSPDSVNFTDGGKEIWRYGFAKAQVSGKAFIPFYGLFNNTVSGTKKELVILFDGDKVSKYSMSESAIDSRSGLAAQ